MENRMSKVILGYTTDSKPKELHKTFSQLKEKNDSGPQAEEYPRGSQSLVHRVREKQKFGC